MRLEQSWYTLGSRSTGSGNSSNTSCKSRWSVDFEARIWQLGAWMRSNILFQIPGIGSLNVKNSLEPGDSLLWQIKQRARLVNVGSLSITLECYQNRCLETWLKTVATLKIMLRRVVFSYYFTIFHHLQMSSVTVTAFRWKMGVRIYDSEITLRTRIPDLEVTTWNLGSRETMTGNSGLIAFQGHRGNCGVESGHRASLYHLQALIMNLSCNLSDNMRQPGQV